MLEKCLIRSEIHHPGPSSLNKLKKEKGCCVVAMLDKRILQARSRTGSSIHW